MHIFVDYHSHQEVLYQFLAISILIVNVLMYEEKYNILHHELLIE